MNESLPQITTVVLITGSREFESRALVDFHLRNIPTPCYLLHGNARGADRLASEIAQTIPGMVELRVPYLNVEGKRGGYMRNVRMNEMLALFRANGFHCWAIMFHDDIRNPTKGTAGMASLIRSGDFPFIEVDGLTGNHELHGWES